MMPAEQYHDFPLAPRDREWDKNEAIPRLRRWASRDGSGDKDQMDWQKYRKVFFWHEAGDLEDFGQFKLPYCDIINGEPHVVYNAVRNALARLPNTDIPEDDKPAVERVARRQLERFQDEESEGRMSRTLGREFGKPTPSQLEKINALAKRPLSAEEVFTFSAKMVGDAIINHPWPVKLHKSLLEVFKKDALSGVAFLLDHSWAGFGRPKPAYPYGRTFDAVLKKGDQEGENWALYGDVYIVRGKELDGVSTDAIIASIEDGTLFDVSVGFGNEVDECSICGNNIWDVSKCEHYPGRVYDGQLCYVIAKPPGYLMELSAVFDGAYPGAMVLSSAGGDGAGDFVLLKDADLKKVNPEVQKFRVYSASRGRVLTFAKRDALERKIWAPFSGFNLYVPDLTQGVPVSMSAAITTTQTASGGGETRVEQQNVQEFISKEKAVEVLGKEYDADTILKFAREGIQYREELIQDTIEWGIRAQGNDFPADAWKQLLSEPGRTIEAIKDFREQFKKQAEAAIPAGRKTAPEVGKGNAAVKSDIPDDCFKA
jgi:hypothetical protein